MPSVALIGTRGYPSYYGGLETAVRKLAPFFADTGWDVTVYGRHGSTRIDDPDADKRVQTKVTKGLETKSLSTLSYGLTSAIDASVRPPDVALVFNVANGFFLPLLRARGVPTLVNVDGIEWERGKWSRLGKRAFRTGAEVTAKWADGLIFDSRGIERYWMKNFGVGGTFIPYGGEVVPLLPIPEGVEHRGYVLLVARFVPENSVGEFFDAVPEIAAKHHVVLVGSSGYGGELDAAAERLASTNPRVKWLGHVSDDNQLFALWQHAGVYFHGHTVGGTNPALVQAMAAGAPVIAADTVYNREVLGSAGIFVDRQPGAIANAVMEMMADPDAQDQAAHANLERAKSDYSWEQVCSSYEQALRQVMGLNLDRPRAIEGRG